MSVCEGGNGEEGCPLCLGPLPPFWDTVRQTMTLCCGVNICRVCIRARQAFLDNANDNGTFGREEEQLGSTCPLCRAQIHEQGDVEGLTKDLKDRFEKGQLPLRLYHDVGTMFALGLRGVEQDIEMGIEILQFGAEGGDPGCQFMLGRMYRKGDLGLPKSAEDAKRWLLTAAEQGHAVAEVQLAFLFRDEGNDVEFLRYLNCSASKGCDDASYSLGVMYYNGDNGFPKSMEEAIRVLTPAAKRGSTQCRTVLDSACFNLGAAHYYGRDGVEQSVDKAIQLLTPAAERGHAVSMGLLGSAMCTDPHDSDQDLPPGNPRWVKGMHWLGRAAEAGDQTAIGNLSIVRSRAVPKIWGFGSGRVRPDVNPLSPADFTKGMHWLRRMVEEGDQTAIFQLRTAENLARRRCFMCQSKAPRGEAFLRCSRCCAAWYCSKDCQLQHWKAEEGGHKQCCIKWK